MQQPKSAAALHGTAYNLFIMLLTILSLVIMVAIVLPLSPATTSLLQVYDNLICVVFLSDFAINLRRAPSPRLESPGGAVKDFAPRAVQPSSGGRVAPIGVRSSGRRSS